MFVSKNVLNRMLVNILKLVNIFITNNLAGYNSSVALCKAVNYFGMRLIYNSTCTYIHRAKSLFNPKLIYFVLILSVLR